MSYSSLPCSKCGAPGNSPCVNLRNGTPLKKFHRDGRIITVAALRPADLKQVPGLGAPLNQDDLDSLLQGGPTC